MQKGRENKRMDLTYPQCSEAGSCKPKKIETDPSALKVRKANLGKDDPLNSDITVSIVKEKVHLPSLLEAGTYCRPHHKSRQSFKQIMRQMLILKTLRKHKKGKIVFESYLLSTRGHSQGLQSSEPPCVASPKNLCNQNIRT